MNTQELQTLFLRQLEDLYALEQLAIQNGERFLTMAKDDTATRAILRWIEEARVCLVRLDSILMEFRTPPPRVAQRGLDRITQEALVRCSSYTDEAVQTAALVATLQRLMNLELSIYGTLIELASYLDASSDTVSQLKTSVREKCFLESEIRRMVSVRPPVPRTGEAKPHLHLMPAV